MRSLAVGMVLVGCLAAACGSSSEDALFGKASENGCSSAGGCGATDTGGAGSDLMGEGGAANLGGQSASGRAGGGEASGGDPGSGGMRDAGGDVGSGGVVGGGGDVGAGGAAHAGAGGAHAADCPVGDYHAVLMGQYRSTLGTNEVGATIDFSVSAKGAAMGSFSGPGGNAKATVTGSVDCSTGALTAKIENGSYGIGIANARFSGTFDGNYDRATSAFAGMWAIMETGSANNGGTGIWSTN